MKNTRRIVRVKAPCCHGMLDSITDVFENAGRMAENGDITICLYCGTALEIVDVEQGKLKIFDITKESPEIQQKIARLQWAMKLVKPRMKFDTCQKLNMKRYVIRQTYMYQGKPEYRYEADTDTLEEARQMVREVVPMQSVEAVVEIYEWKEDKVIEWRTNEDE